MHVKENGGGLSQLPTSCSRAIKEQTPPSLLSLFSSLQTLVLADDMMDSTQKYIRPGTYCAACKGIFKGLLVLDHARPHHSDGAALEQSASTGCQLCFFLWDMLTDTEREWIRRHDERPVEQYKAKDQVLSDPATSYTLSRSADDYSMKYTFLADRYKDDRHSVAKTMGLMPESCACPSNFYLQPKPSQLRC